MISLVYNYVCSQIDQSTKDHSCQIVLVSNLVIGGTGLTEVMDMKNDGLKHKMQR